MLFWTILGHFWCSVKTLVTGISKCNTFKNKTKNLKFPNLNIIVEVTHKKSHKNQ